MKSPAWKERVLKAIEDSGRSDREISLSVGRGENFVNQFRGKRTPSVENLLALCEELNVSISYIFLGSNITHEMEEMLTLFSSLPPDNQKRVVDLMQALMQAASTQP